MADVRYRDCNHKRRQEQCHCALFLQHMLAESEVVLDNLPLLSDVAVYAEILEELGARVILGRQSDED